MADAAEGRNTGKHGERPLSAPAPPFADDLMERLAALEMEREKYRTLFSQANEAVFLVEIEEGGQGRALSFAEVNDTACAWLGYSPGEFSEMVPQEIIAPDDRPLLPAYRKTLADETWITVELGLQTRSGREIPVEMSARVTLRFDIARGRRIAEPRFRTRGPIGVKTNRGPHFATTAHGPDLFASSQQAIRYMIEHLVDERGLTREEAYVLCSVAVDLKISEIVDAPNWIVSAFLPESVFV